MHLPSVRPPRGDFSTSSAHPTLTIHVMIRHIDHMNNRPGEFDWNAALEVYKKERQSEPLLKEPLSKDAVQDITEKAMGFK